MTLSASASSVSLGAASFRARALLESSHRLDRSAFALVFILSS